MKIKIECTVEVDPKVIKQLMQQRLWVFCDKHLADSGETIQSFVRSHIISVGVQCFNESLSNARLPDSVYIIKTNI